MFALDPRKIVVGLESVVRDGKVREKPSGIRSTSVSNANVLFREIER